MEVVQTRWQHVVEELYQGEVLGEALFNRMLRDLDDDRERYVVGSLLQLETETKVLLRRAAAARGLRLDEDDAPRTEGEEIAASLRAMTWLGKMQRLQAGISDYYLPRYQLIAAEAGADDREVTSLMVRHETALLEVLARETAGQIETSLIPLEGHLRFPLSHPPG
ncbi:MAG TPA: hypothetical protein VFH02_10610 [Jiangellaceae bacterium]|nr:hypothetical protein [Jiangellaceae bacterium]